VFLLLCVSGQAAEAQTATPSPPAQTSAADAAMEQYERGRAHYASGRYRAAVHSLEAAWRLDPSGSNLLFNLGTVYERMGDLDRARGAYLEYLARAPDATERERTQRILTRLQGARLELAEGRRRRGRADGWFFATTGLALASTAVGVTWLVSQQEFRPDPAPMALTLGGAGLGILATVLYFARYAPAPRSFYE